MNQELIKITDDWITQVEALSKRIDQFISKEEPDRALYQILPDIIKDAKVPDLNFDIYIQKIKSLNKEKT